jgi:hypothetical protein
MLTDDHPSADGGGATERQTTFCSAYRYRLLRDP